MNGAEEEKKIVSFTKISHGVCLSASVLHNASYAHLHNYNLKCTEVGSLGNSYKEMLIQTNKSFKVPNFIFWL